MNVVVFSEQGKTFSDSIIPTLISSEICCELLFLGWTVLLSDDSLFVEDDSLGPLHKSKSYLVLLLEFFFETLPVQFTFHLNCCNIKSDGSVFLRFTLLEMLNLHYNGCYQMAQWILRHRLTHFYQTFSQVRNHIVNQVLPYWFRLLIQQLPLTFFQQLEVEALLILFSLLSLRFFSRWGLRLLFRLFFVGLILNWSKTNRAISLNKLFQFIVAPRTC